MLECWSVVEKMKAAGPSLMIGRCQFDLQSQILAYILYPGAISPLTVLTPSQLVMGKCQHGSKYLQPQ